MRFLRIACIAVCMAVFMSVSAFAATGCDLTVKDGFFVKGGKTFFGPVDFTGVKESDLQVWNSIASSLSGEGVDTVLVILHHAESPYPKYNYLNFYLVAPADAALYYESSYYRIKYKSCFSFSYDFSKSVWTFRGVWRSSNHPFSISPHSFDIVLHDGITGLLGSFPKAQYTGAFSFSNAVERTLTVKYQFENGLEAAGTNVSTYTVGKNYGVDSPTLKGFTASSSVVSGEMPDQDLEVVVIYYRNAYELTVEYFDEGGQSTASTYSRAVLYDYEYTVLSPDLDGYTPTEASVTGRMPDRDLNYAVTYIKDPEPPPTSSSEPDTPSSSAPEPPSGNNPYVPWSPARLAQGVRQNYLVNVGVVVDICFKVFLYITGVLLIIKIGNSLVG